jgi:hypothetical protein
VIEFVIVESNEERRILSRKRPLRGMVKLPKAAEMNDRAGTLRHLQLASRCMIGRRQTAHVFAIGNGQD